MTARLEALLREIEVVDDFDTRGELLIESAERFVPVPPHVAERPYPEGHRAQGCESEAYAWACCSPEGRLTFYFAVENPQGISAKALATLLKEGLDGCRADDLTQVSEDLVYRIFGRGVSMGKGHGLMGLVRVVKEIGRRAALAN